MEEGSVNELSIIFKILNRK